MISTMKSSPSDDTLPTPKKDAPDKKRGSKSGPLTGAFVKTTRKNSSIDSSRAEVFASRNGLEKLLVEFCPSPNEHNCLQKRKDRSTKNYTNSLEHSSSYVHPHTDLSKVNEPSLAEINYKMKRSDLMKSWKNVPAQKGSIMNFRHHFNAERRARFPLGELKYYRPNIQKQQVPQQMQRKVSFTKKYGSMMCGSSSTVIVAAFSKPVNPL
ncbi:hypothetical protein O6H91_13G025000 [Diphasiastrum complanatum]|nr:hypothetical protein O6H91_13G025000 [Diphasiastrum complanatum]